MSIADSLTNLDAKRDALAANLVTMGVTAANSETLASLVPKVLDIATGTDTSDATAAAADIATGKTAYVATGKVTGTSTAVETGDADAAAGDIASGKTAYVNGSKVTGTLVSGVTGIGLGPTSNPVVPNLPTKTVAAVVT